MQPPDTDQIKEDETTSKKIGKFQRAKEMIMALDKALSLKHPLGFTVFTSIVFILGSVCSELKYGESRREAMHNITHKPEPKTKPIYWLYPTTEVSDDFENLQTVLRRLGYKQEFNSSNWDVLWATNFTNITEELTNLESHQKVNHIPGSGNITNKMYLSMTESKFIPKSFRLPEELKEFREYVQSDHNKLFVEKSNNRRGVLIKNPNEFVINDEETFVQEYVGNPLLVDGYKFDVGVYAIITSISPLRVYIYNGDFLITKCTTKYYPFDALKTDKYVKPNGSLPEDKQSSIAMYNKAFGQGMRDSLKAYFRRKGLTLNKVWLQMEQAIAEICEKNEDYLIEAVDDYPWTRNFFEIIRFDFMVDNKLNVHLLKAKANPEGFSEAIRQDHVFCDQLLYSALNLLGIGHLIMKPSLRIRSPTEELMQSAERNIMVNGNICVRDECIASCNLTECLLCRTCLEPEMMKQLHDAYREHVNRIECKRVFPPTMTGEDLSEDYLKEYSLMNQLMIKWFNAKCKNNKSWC